MVGGVDRRSGAAGGPKLVGRVLVHREGEVVERSPEHDAVVTGRRVDTDVLVEDVVEHRGRVTVEGITPTTAAAVVVHDALAGGDRNPVGGVRNSVRVVG